MVLVLRTSSDNALYLYQVWTKSQRVSEIQTGTVGSTLGWSQMLTDGQPDVRTDGRMDERIENRIPISRHTWGRCDRNGQRKSLKQKNNDSTSSLN